MVRRKLFVGERRRRVEMELWRLVGVRHGNRPPINDLWGVS
jgi:hypothetical protein